MAPEELPLPTPATAPKPPADELPLDDEVPQLPMTPDLPLGDVPGEVNAPSQQTPSSDTQILPPSGQPQVPVFGDEPQAPPSAAGPGATPFGDEPPQPPADEEPLPTEPIPTEAPANLAPEQAPAATPGQGQPGTNMPFDVGPSPTMPAEDPFKDDPDQGLFEPQSGTRLEQSPTDRYGLNRPVPADDSNFEPTYAVEQSQPRLLRADGGSLEATRLPEASPGDNPLRQVSHPVRRTAATQGELPNTAPKTWRRNPLRDR